MEQVTVDQQVMPQTFREYLRSMGPGIIVVLTWLGAGDIVECGVSGGGFHARTIVCGWADVNLLDFSFLLLWIFDHHHEIRHLIYGNPKQKKRTQD